MKITTKRTDLQEAAGWVARAVSRNASMPILMAMRIEAGDEGVTLSAFDYELALSATVPAEVGEPGSVLVPGHAFVAYLAAARGDDVALHLDGSRVVVEIGKSRSEFPLVGQQEDYPRLPEMGDQPIGTIDAEVLDDVLDRLGPLAGPRLQTFDIWSTGVHLLARDGQLIFEAGVRQCVGRVERPTTISDLDILVPAVGLTAAIKGLRGELAVHHEGETLGLAAGDRTVTLALVAGRFPGLDAIFTADPPDHVGVDRDEMLAALRSVSTSSDRVRIQIEPGLMTLTTFDPEKGDRRSTVTDSLAATSEASGELLASISYLTHCLNGLDEGEVGIDCHLDAVKQALVANGHTRYAFMPFRDPRSTR